MKEYLTACPRNCYSTCTFRVFTKEGRVVRILPSESNLATPGGPCIKGLAYLEREYSVERLIYPLRRNQAGGFDRITMTEALETIASELDRARKNHSPHSVLFYRGSGLSGLSNDISGAFWKAFGGATTTYGNLCWPAGLEAVRLTLGEVKHNVPWDLGDADLIIMWGKNPAETNIQEMVHVEKAIKRGAKLIVIDPRRTPTADKAELLLRPAPGTDAAVALAVAGILIERGYADMSFIARYVKGFDAFASSLTIDAAKAEKISGVPAFAITQLAEMIGTSDRVTIIPGYGLQRYTNGGQTIRTLLALQVITGKIGRRGCGFNFANLQGYIYDDIREPVSYYPDPANDKPFRRCISMARFGNDFFSLQDPPVMVAWIERGNPVTQLPDSTAVVRALNSIPFKVVTDHFMTDTAAMADIILPAKGVFEQSDIVSSYWNPYVQYRPKIIDPPGDVIPESEIYHWIALKLGLTFDNTMIPEPGNENFEIWLKNKISRREITLDQLRQGPVIPGDLEKTAYSSMIFPTSSGKIELESELASELWGVDTLPSYVPLDNEPDDLNPFRLITPNIGSRIHSQFGNLSVIRSVTEPVAWELSPADALKLGIEDGDRIIVSNSHGEVSGIVRITSRVKQGTVIFPNGIWLAEGGGVNRLIAGRETDMGHGAAFHNTRVNIRREQR